MILWSFKIFLIFPNFVRSEVLSCSAACEINRINQFITNNNTSFYLRCKENLLNYKKVPIFYEHYYLQNFRLLFMFLLTALIVKNSDILAWTYFMVLKNVLYQTWKASNTKFGPHWKDRENSYQVRQILTLFYKLVALILV